MGIHLNKKLSFIFILPNSPLTLFCKAIRQIPHWWALEYIKISHCQENLTRANRHIESCCYEISSLVGQLTFWKVLECHICFTIWICRENAKKICWLYVQLTMNEWMYHSAGKFRRVNWTGHPNNKCILRTTLRQFT